MGSGSPASLSQTDGQGPDRQDAPRRLANGDRAESPGGGDARSCPCRLAVREQQCVAGGAGQTMPQPAAQSGLSPPPEREALGVRGEKGQRQPRARPGTGGARSGAGTASQHRDEGGDPEGAPGAAEAAPASGAGTGTGPAGPRGPGRYPAGDSY